MKKKHKPVKLPSYVKVLCFVVVVLVITYFLWPSTQKTYLTRMSHVRHDAKLHLPKGDVFVQLADDPNEREIGLSFRPTIGNNEGLLFIFDTPGQYGFWMKDMQFPIDMVWIASSGQVVHIEENVATSTYPTSFSNTSSAIYVLELNANMAHTYGLYLGTPIDIGSIKK